MPQIIGFTHFYCTGYNNQRDYTNIEKKTNYIKHNLKLHLVDMIYNLKNQRRTENHANTNIE